MVSSSQRAASQCQARGTAHPPLTLMTTKTHQESLA